MSVQRREFGEFKAFVFVPYEEEKKICGFLVSDIFMLERKYKLIYVGGLWAGCLVCIMNLKRSQLPKILLNTILRNYYLRHFRHIPLKINQMYLIECVKF